MARPPNFQQERNDRERAKAAKAARKAAAKSETRAINREAAPDADARPED